MIFKNSSRSKTLPFPFLRYFICHPSPAFIRLLRVIWSYLSRENYVRFNHSLNERVKHLRRCLNKLVLHTPKTFHTTIKQDLNPRPCTVNDHLSVLAHEMIVIEPGEKPTCILTWKTTGFLNYIQSRSHKDHFPIPLWETWFCQSLGVPIPVLLENPRQCPCRQFSFYHYGDHIQTCHRQSVSLLSL